MHDCLNRMDEGWLGGCSHMLYRSFGRRQGLTGIAAFFLGVRRSKTAGKPILSCEVARLLHEDDVTLRGVWPTEFSLSFCAD